MSKSTFPILIRDHTPTRLFNQILTSIAAGNDLHAPLFVDARDTLCQFVVPSLCLYEYRLIEAFDVDDLETQVQSLASLGFDFIFNTVQWNGEYLQWMARMTNSELTVKKVIVENTQVNSPVSIMEKNTEVSTPSLSLVKEAMPVMRGRFLTGGLQ